MSDNTLNDAYKYVLALVSVNPDDAIKVQHEYRDEELRDLFGAVAGVVLGIFTNMSPKLRSQIELSMRYAVTGDESFLQAAAKAAEPLPGQYL
jgi:hypothetical protein